jgi:hypothetical protein
LTASPSLLWFAHAHILSSLKLVTMAWLLLVTVWNLLSTPRASVMSSSSGVFVFFFFLAPWE